MRKRGQFYLVTAIIIISIITGFIAIVNYANRGQTIIVDDLKDELQIESQKVLEYEISNPGDTMNDFGVAYSKHIGSEFELYFIMGSGLNIDAYQYINGIEKDVDVLDEASLTIDSGNGKIILTLDNIDYEFALIDGENFYFLISQEIKQERFVVTG